MTPAAERYARAHELFDAAVDLAPRERAALLDERCADNEALRREVEALLEADAQSSSFAEEPVFSIPANLFPEEPDEQLAGQRFGVYEVIREIGRGGLGAVSLAARADDEYRKEVALKLIRRGLDTDDILRRFRTERQILAQLDHPNIARLLDGGTTDNGLPYFVMEYVKGEPITAYCDQHALKLNERLELFRKVCAAVTYAHQNLVVHRDLKPSNILVTAEGEPKLLDFGIAKLLSADDDMSFTQTAPGLRAMTPEYASPEQVRGERITTASDVYSLGVLLYEVLTGEKPYRLKGRTAEELSRAIVEQEPERPSTAAAAHVASDRRPGRAAPASLDTDLDNIVLMAMRKEPQRRYASAAALAEDIRRHQDGLPVTARPHTYSYRATKFIKRHRAAAVAAALILLAIIGGLITTLWQAGVARAAQARAEKRFSDVRRLANSNLFEVYPEVENLAGSLKAREAILRNALTYLDSLANESEGDTELQSELASAYEKVGDVQGALNNSNLGNVQAGLDSYAKARKLRTAVWNTDKGNFDATKRLANNYYTSARTLWNNNQTKEAEEAFVRTIELQRALIQARPDAVDLKNQLAVTLIDYAAIPVFNFQAEKALPLFGEAMTINAGLRQQNPDDVDLMKTRARALRVLSKAQTIKGDHAAGLASLREAWEISRDLAARFPQDFRLQRAVWLTEYISCEVLVDKGDGAEAVNGCANITAFPKAALAKEPENGVVAYDLATSHFNKSRAYRLADQPEQTIDEARAALDVMAKLSAKEPANPEYKRNVAIYGTEMARAQIKLGRAADALPTLREARETLQLIVGANPSTTTYRYDVAMTDRLSAEALHKLGDHPRAIESVDRAIAEVAQLRELKSLRESDKHLSAELEQEKASYLAAAQR
jgi:non-specific serine/threonine protein kinase/serine/threonine-protein kinase